MTLDDTLRVGRIIGLRRKFRPCVDEWREMRQNDVREAESPGMFIGKYEIISDLGDGGMGTAKLARAPSGNLVVVKMPHPGDPLLRDLLIDEARVGLKLKHPNIVDTIDFFEHDGTPVLVVAYVSGASLADIRAIRPLDAGVVCRVARQICEALDALHHSVSEDGKPLNVIHRDVTPNNIMVGYDGNARLIDLGIAKHDDRMAQKTQTGFLRGTLRYMAPEVFDASAYSPQSDLWALGISLLDAALGRQSIRGSEGEIVAKVMTGRIIELRPGETLDKDLEKALLKLLSTDPKKRPRRGNEAAALFIMLEKKLGVDANTTRDALRRIIGEEPVLDDRGEEATMLLVTRASAAYAARPVTSSDALVDDAKSVPAPVTLGIEEPSFAAPDRTMQNAGLRDVARAASLVTGTPPFGTPPTARDALSSYAESLRSLEGKTGETAIVGTMLPALEEPTDPGADGATPNDDFDDENEETMERVKITPYPKIDDRRPIPLMALGIGVGLLLGLVVIILAAGRRESPMSPTEEAALLEGSVGDEFAIADGRAGDRPTCFVEKQTKFFAYKNEEGVLVSTTRLSEVPIPYRGSVLCGE